MMRKSGIGDGNPLPSYGVVLPGTIESTLDKYHKLHKDRGTALNFEEAFSALYDNLAGMTKPWMEELVACSVASTVNGMLQGEKYSSAALNNIIKLHSECVGVVLAAEDYTSYGEFVRDILGSGSGDLTMACHEDVLLSSGLLSSAFITENIEESTRDCVEKRTDAGADAEKGTTSPAQEDESKSALADDAFSEMAVATITTPTLAGQTKT
ncbi:MAG: hypothetical protein ACTJLK_04030 [Anaplasma sp.]